MSKAIKVTEPTVTIKAQGVVREVDASEFHADSINAIFTYGLRRWVQDHVNSVAKSHRDEGETFDAESLVAARIDQAVTGEINMRNGTPSDPLDQYRIAVLRDFMRTENGADLKAAYDDIPSDDQKARREFLLTIAAKNADNVDPAATERKRIDDAAKADASGLALAM